MSELEQSISKSEAERVKAEGLDQPRKKSKRSKRIEGEEPSMAYSIKITKRGDRKSYGNMLPKTGVYFLPDTKVIDFLRVLTEYKK